MAACAECGYEFESPVAGPAGPACPRCGEPTGAAVGRWPPVAGIDDYLSAALAGAALGLLVAGVLFLSRF